MLNFFKGKFTKTGFKVLLSNRDTITYVWPWRKEYSKISKVFSMLHNLYFPTLKKYYNYLDEIEEVCKSSKVVGYSMEDVLLHWVRTKFQNQLIVVLIDFNLSSKPSSFWRNIPRGHRVQFTKDFVVLFCNTKDEVISISESIDPSSGSAFGFNKGALISWNEVETELSYENNI